MVARYVQWDAPGVEVIDDGEEELKKTIAGQFNELQKMHFQQNHHGMRATHVKTQGVSRLQSNLATWANSD